MSTGQIIFIIKTGIVTLIFLFGVYLLVMSKSRMETSVGKLFGSNDLELTTGNFVFVKVVGAGMVVVSGLLAWKFLL